MRRSHARNRVENKPNSPDMDPVKPQIRPLNRSGNLISRNSKQIKSPLLVTAASLAALLVFLLCCYLFFSARPYYNPGGSRRYGIVIDGGSTGTRIYVFSYRVGGGSPVFDFGQKFLETSMKVNPGLSAYAEDQDNAGGSLVELVEFAKGKVPKELWRETEIRLMATAGLRLLELSAQERILDACRRVLRSSGFKFRDEWASVISGSDEGIYAWVVANYALGTLGGDPLKTTGIIELGGASAQVTFVSTEPMPPEFSHTVEFGNVTYNLYSHSFLHFGQNVAYQSLRQLLISGDLNSAAESLHKGIYIDPCTPKGYLPGSGSWKFSPGSSDEKNKYISNLQAGGNFSECRSAALMMLQKGNDKCFFEHCKVGSVFVPKLQGKFLATENFFHTYKFFELRPRAFLSDLMMAGEQFCGEEWSKLKRKHHSLDEEDLVHYCFSSAYILALLSDSLGIALDDERIRVANQVGDIRLDWPLGAFILQSTANMDVNHPDWISTIINDDSPTLLYLICIVVIVMFTAWSASKCRKPHLKTIYDLEKGRYIVTRISR